MRGRFIGGDPLIPTSEPAGEGDPCDVVAERIQIPTLLLGCCRKVRSIPICFLLETQRPFHGSGY